MNLLGSFIANSPRLSTVLALSLHHKIGFEWEGVVDEGGFIAKAGRGKETLLAFEGNR